MHAPRISTASPELVARSHLSKGGRRRTAWRNARNSCVTMAKKIIASSDDELNGDVNQNKDTNGRETKAPERDRKRKRGDKGKQQGGSSSSSSPSKGKDSSKPAKKTGQGGGGDDDAEPPRDKEQAWSKSKKKRMRVMRAKGMKKKEEGGRGGTTEGDEKAEVKNEGSPSNRNGPSSSAAAVTARASSALQERYASRLAGSRFRALNEELYTATSQSAFERFRSEPELFDRYHEGFRRQVTAWPSNPVDAIHEWLARKYDDERTITVVADFGCGDAELARRLSGGRRGRSDDGDGGDRSRTPCPFEVHSFDLVARSPLVTACDMANVPIEDRSVDVAIFCLALMGTNVADFLLEAHRVIKDNGKVKIAEVRSRFETAGKSDNNKDNNKRRRRRSGSRRNMKNGNDDNTKSNSNTDPLDGFVEQLDKLGFKLCGKVDRSNKMFILMELEKNGNEPDRKVSVQIRPCIYKRR